MFQCLVNRVLRIMRVSVVGYLCFRDCACFSAWIFVFKGLCVFQCLVNCVSGIVLISMLG